MNDARELNLALVEEARTYADNYDGLINGRDHVLADAAADFLEGSEPRNQTFVEMWWWDAAPKTMRRALVEWLREADEMRDDDMMARLADAVEDQ